MAQASQLTVWPNRVAEMEQRIGQLDDELETSKRLFESKSIEAEALKLKVSDLERYIYETEQSASNQAGDLEALRRDIDKLKRDLSASTKDLRSKETLLSETKAKLVQSINLLHERERDLQIVNSEHESILLELEDLKQSVEADKNKLEMDEVN